MFCVLHPFFLTRQPVSPFSPSPAPCATTSSYHCFLRFFQFVFASALVVPFLCPWQKADVPRLWFAGQRYLLEHDVTRLHEPARTCVRQLAFVTKWLKMPRCARVVKRDVPLVSGSCAFTSSLHHTTPSVSLVSFRFLWATNSQHSA